MLHTALQERWRCSPRYFSCRLLITLWFLRREL